MTGTKQNYECDICHKKFRAMYSYLFHLKQEHKVDI